jgi:pimeloyl-ACP methyl ester carboxylesterase
MRPWIFLRGLVREQRHWGNFVSLFSEKNQIPRENIHCLDLAGMGTERGRRVPRDMRGLVDDLRYRFREIRQGSVGSPYIFSMSLGSMCAMEWAHLYPDEVGGLVLINASAKNLAQVTERLQLGAIKSFMDIIGEHDPVEREMKILGITSHFHKKNRELAREWALWAPPKKELIKVALAQLWIASLYQAPRSLDVPALILSSAQDRLASPLCSHRMAENWGLENYVNLVAGHDLPLDDPDWVILRTQEWLAQRS